MLSQKFLILPGGEWNPGLPRDRRGYSPLYYRGFGKQPETRYPVKAGMFQKKIIKVYWF